MSDTAVYTRRDVAHAARVFGQENELSGYGKRGRVSENLVLQYLQALPAKTVREIAVDLGIEIPQKGKVSEAEFLSVSGAVARNAPKTEGE
jgi:hypothetical protein